MPNISQAKIRKLFIKSNRAKTHKTKGTVFEDLICYVFQKVPGIKIAKRNVLNPYHSEEIDVAIWNDKLRSGFSFLPNIVLIEAKNWSTAVGGSEITEFTAKLESRRIEVGFFVAANGITGNVNERSAGRDRVRQALMKGIKIIILKRADIETFKNTDQFIEFVKEKLCELAASGTQFD